MGLCPLHAEQQPSFVVDAAKNLFYCYGCGRGGDLIRFVELYFAVGFRDAMTLLRSRDRQSLLKDVVSFYQIELHRHPEAAHYLLLRGIQQPQIIEELAIGYAPGRCLRPWLMTLGYSLSDLQQAGLVNTTGHDTFSQRVVFPLEANLYGRSIVNAPAHRFLPGAKGGLYAWERVKQSPEVILVEGLFDLAALWQAGFRNATCAMGSHLNARQLQQLCDGGSRTVYLAFDSDVNGCGKQPTQELSRRLLKEGVTALRGELPNGNNPTSFFAPGGDAKQFHPPLEEATP